MKTRTTMMAFLAMVLGACAPASAPPRPVPASETRAVEAAIQQWYDASARHDSASYAALMLPEFFILEDTTRYDRTSILSLVVAGFARGVDRATITDWDTQVSGDVAWTTFRNTEVFTPTGGAPGSPRRFLESAILRKVGGQWKLARYHATRINRPAAR